MNLNETVDALKARRKALRLTQHQVADLSGLWQSSISSFETGRVTPRHDALLPWAHSLGLRVSLELIQADPPPALVASPASD